MNILGFDTATPVTSVAVTRDGVIAAEMSMTSDKAQMERLMPMIDATLAEAGLKIKDITGIAVGTGPGLFTSLRIGVVTANTLAQVLGVPVTGISSLDALALGAGAGRDLVAAAIDARRNEVFATLYEAEDSAVTRKTGIKAVAPQAYAAELTELGRPVTMVGDGFVAYGEIFKAMPKALGRVAAPGRTYPKASNIIALAEKDLENASPDTHNLVVPIYIRMPDADELIKKMRK